MRAEAAAKRQAREDKAARKEERQRRRKEKDEKKALKAAKKVAKTAGEGGDQEGGADGDADASAFESDEASDVEDDAPTSDSGEEDGAAMDEDEASGDEAPKRKSSKAKPVKTSTKGSKKNGERKGAEARPEAMDAVSSEIAIMKTLEAGPSEADLRRRRLVTIDEDERVDLVDRLNQAAAAVLARAQCSSVEQECRQLRDIKAWINARRGEEGEEADRVRADLEDALNKRTDLLEDR